MAFDKIADDRLLDVHERLARVESRLVQLMLYMGADPHGKNNEGKFIDVLMEAKAHDSFTPQAGIPEGATIHSAGISPVCPDWAEFERPTCLRRR